MGLLQVNLEFSGNEGGVLLNTANVSSIHYQLVDDYDADGELEQAKAR